MKLGTLMTQVKKMIKKLIKSGGQDPLTKTARRPKLDKKERFFSMVHVLLLRI